MNDNDNIKTVKVGTSEKELGTWCTSAVRGELLCNGVHLSGSLEREVTKLSHRLSLNNGTAVLKIYESHRAR